MNFLLWNLFSSFSVFAFDLFVCLFYLFISDYIFLSFMSELMLLKVISHMSITLISPFTRHSAEN